MKGLPTPLVNGMATVCRVGKIKPAPGTWGSAVGTLFYALLLQNAPQAVVFAAVIVLLIAGVFFCDEAERRMNARDPGCIVLDEFVAMQIVYLGLATPESLHWRIIQLFAGFLLFRFFDIAKPLGISRLQDLPGGLGVMADDILAAVFSCAILHVLTRLVVMFA